MTLRETFELAVAGRKAGRKCQVEHPEWTEMDTVTVKSFIPRGLRMVYWATLKGNAKGAYIAAESVKPRASYEPWMWRLPEAIRVDSATTVPTAELLQMVDEAKGRWLGTLP